MYKGNSEETSQESFSPVNGGTVTKTGGSKTEYKKYTDIIDVVMELAIEDELYTRLSGESTFVKGDISLTYLKRQIYPYFLMYLGSSVEDYTNYMRRDGITFDIEKYPIEKELAKLNLIEFIEYCIKNQYKILHINQLEIV